MHTWDHVSSAARRPGLASWLPYASMGGQLSIIHSHVNFHLLNGPSPAPTDGLLGSEGGACPCSALWPERGWNESEAWFLLLIDCRPWAPGPAFLPPLLPSLFQNLQALHSQEPYLQPRPFPCSAFLPASSSVRTSSLLLGHSPFMLGPNLISSKTPLSPQTLDH